MDLFGSTRPLGDTTNSLEQTRMMPESSTLAQISVYVAENKLMAALETESQEMLVV